MFAIVLVLNFCDLLKYPFFWFRNIWKNDFFFNYPMFVNVVKILNTVLPKKDFIADQ